MLDIPTYLTDIRQLGTLLAGALTAVAALGALVMMVARRSSDLPVKLLGSLLVLAICFAAQSAVVYGIGVFVVATLVTELQFLEKIAALVWNRKEYWDYLGKASRSEVAKKIDAETREIEAADAQPIPLPTARENGRAERVLRPGGRKALSGFHFHHAVLGALTTRSPIPYTGIRTDVKLVIGSRSMLLDAILETTNAIYVVEIKAGYSPRLLREAIAQLIGYMASAEHVVLGRRYAAYDLRGVVVIPPSVDAPLHQDGVVVLQFDPEAGEFVNGTAVREYLAHAA